jgi:antitoxin (DNA-binding transcriptional repressor) of toxin-antitoxin stability system
MTEQISLTSSDLQRRGRDVLDAVLVGRHVEITRWNRAVAIVVSPEWYQRAADLMTAAETGE